MTKLSTIKKTLSRKGLKIMSYKPGKRRLYQVVKVDGRSGAITKQLTPGHIPLKELKAWYKGFIS